MPLWEVWRQEWIQVCKPCLYTIWGTFFNKHNFINANVLCYAYSLSHGQLFVTPWSVAHQAPLSMGFPWQEYWSGLPCTPPGDLPNPGIELGSPALQADTLLSEPPGNSPLFCCCFIFYFSVRLQWSPLLHLPDHGSFLLYRLIYHWYLTYLLHYSHCILHLLLVLLYIF